MRILIYQYITTLLLIGFAIFIVRDLHRAREYKLNEENEYTTKTEMCGGTWLSQSGIDVFRIYRNVVSPIIDKHFSKAIRSFASNDDLMLLTENLIDSCFVDKTDRKVLQAAHNRLLQEVMQKPIIK